MAAALNMRINLFLAALLACFISLPALAGSDSLSIQNASVMVKPESMSMTGAFLIITNEGEADRLLGVKIPDAMAELHSMKMNDKGVMEMRAAAGFDIPAAGKLELVPGGNHIMVMGLKKELAAGTKLPLTLMFDKVGEKTIEADVLTPQQMSERFSVEKTKSHHGH